MQILSIIKQLITSNTVNFIIMLTILCWIINKINLGKSFEHGIDFVKNTILISDDAKAQAQKAFDTAKSQYDNLPSDIKNLENNNLEKINIFKNKINNNTEAILKNLDKNTDKIISVEEKNISNQLKETFTQDSIDLAKKNIIKLLKQNPELHKKFIQDGINELDKVNI